MKGELTEEQKNYEVNFMLPFQIFDLIKRNGHYSNKNLGLVWISFFWIFCRKITVAIWYMWDKKMIEKCVHGNVLKNCCPNKALLSFDNNFLSHALLWITGTWLLDPFNSSSLFQLIWVSTCRKCCDMFTFWIPNHFLLLFIVSNSCGPRRA